MGDSITFEGSAHCSGIYYCVLRLPGCRRVSRAACGLERNKEVGEPRLCSCCVMRLDHSNDGLMQTGPCEPLQGESACGWLVLLSGWVDRLCFRERRLGEGKRVGDGGTLFCTICFALID